MVIKFALKRLIGVLLLSALMAALAAALLRGPSPAAAQETPPPPPSNLLKNGSLETPYYGQGPQTRTVPNAWNLWIGTGDPNALPHNDPLQVLDGSVAWSIKQSGATFTAAGYQQVTVNPGDSLRASAWGWVFTCNDAIKSCATTEPPYHRSDPTAGAALRVGIDPAGGTDPAAASVQWSAALAPYDQWVEMSVTTAAQGSTVTVFLYMTQAQGLVLNEVYWDKASLEIAAPGTTTADTGGEVPYVVPQGVRPDGSIVHVVQTGDTLWSIAYAYIDYNVTVESIAELNGLKANTRILQPNQELQILPPGSVDPVTGQMITPGARVATSTPRADMTAIPTGTPRADMTATGDPSAEPAATRETEPLPLAGAPRSPTPDATATESETPTPKPTATPTEVPTDTPAPTDTPTSAPTATATPEPTATPQEVAALVNTTGTLCAMVYEDRNRNALHDPDESALSSAQVTIQGAGVDETHDSAEPLCLDLPAGQYTVSAAAPASFGLTSADSVIVGLVSGRRIEVAFGAAEGYTLPPAPQATDSGAEMIPSGAVAPVVAEPQPDQDNDETALDRLYDQSGVILLGVAAVILLGGIGLVLALRRAS